MSQGPRRGWVRAVFTGLGVIVCTGLVGCWSTDKDKDQYPPPKYGANTKQAGPGLQGTARLPGMPGDGRAGLNGQQNTGVQPAGGFNTTGGRTTGGTNFNTNPGAGLGGGPGGVVPQMGPGGSSGSSNFGSMGQSNLGPASPVGGGNFAGGASNFGGAGQPLSPAAPIQRDPNLAPPNPPDLSLNNGDIIPPAPNTYRPN